MEQEPSGELFKPGVVRIGAHPDVPFGHFQMCTLSDNMYHTVYFGSLHDNSDSFASMGILKGLIQSGKDVFLMCNKNDVDQNMESIFRS